MQIMSVREAREGCSKMFVESQKVPVLVLKHGKPSIVVRGADGTEIRSRPNQKIFNVSYVRDHIAEVMTAAQAGPVLVLNTDAPTAMLEGVEGRALEEVIRELDVPAPAPRSKK